jgi:hypothetical protein
MINNKTLLIRSLILIAAGTILLTVYWVVFVPKFVALQHDIQAWANNTPHSLPMPSPEAYGLNPTAMIISSILSGSGVVLLFLGSAFLVIVVLVKILKPKGNQETENPYKLKP